MPESSSGRTLLSFWWIFCLITMATYCGNLIAFLTVTKAKLPFTNIHELVQQDQYRWGLTSGTHWVDQFKVSVSYKWGLQPLTGLLHSSYLFYRIFEHF